MSRTPDHDAAPARRRGDGTVTRTETGYLASPTGAPRAVVAVLHAWWGLTPVITGVCDDLADLGYVAVAPDLYRGAVATTAAEAAELRARKRSTPMWRQIVSEIERARSQFDVAAVGQIGFSMGGHWALWLAKQSRPEIPPITATSVFYATRAGDFTASRSAFQFHLADTDPFVTEAGVARQVRPLRAAGRHVELHRYPHTGHWFFEHDRLDAYDPDAASLAWRRTVDFLDRHLPHPTHPTARRAKAQSKPRPVTPPARSFKDTLTGGPKRELRNSAVIDAVLADPDRVDELFACVFDEDAYIRMRAADALEKIGRAQPPIVAPLTDRILTDMALVDQPSVQWHVAQLVSTLPLNNRQRQRGITLVQQYLDTSDDWIVLTQSMHTIASFAEHDESLRHPLLPRLAELSHDPRPSVARLASKLHGQLEAMPIRPS